MRYLLANIFAIDFARGMARVALAWLMLRQYGAAGLSAVVLAMSVGQFLGSVLAGSMTDRGDRRRFTRDSSWICGIGLAIVGVLIGGDYASVPAVCMIVLPVYATLSVHDNAARTLIPVLVADDGIERSNGHFITTGEIGSFIGPMVAGWLIAVYRPGTVIGLAAASCLIAALVIHSMRPPAHQEHKPEVARPTAGWPMGGYLLENGWLIFGLALAVLGNILLVPISQVLVPLRINEVGYGAVELGYFYAAMSVGLAAAGVSKVGNLAVWSSEVRLPVFLAAGSVVYILTFFFEILPFIVLCGAGAGFFLGRFEIGWSSVMQRRTKADMLGRVYGLGSWTSFAGRTIGVAGAGVLVTSAGVQAATLTFVVTLLIAVLTLGVMAQIRVAQRE